MLLREKKDKKKELFHKWLMLKQTENDIKKERNKIESEIELLYPFENGNSHTFKEDDFAINIKRNYVYKFDQQLWAESRKNLPKKFRPEKIEYKVDVERLKELDEYLHKTDGSNIYKSISDCIEMKQNKSTIKITIKEEKNGI